MFRSFSVGAVCALLAVFLIAAIGKWVDCQPNGVVVVRGVESSHTMGTVVWADSSLLMHEGGTLYGGVFKFSIDASDLMRPGAQRSSI
jgi:hypothetical protein